MSILLFFLGFFIVTATILDILYTVLAPNGSGLITGKLSHWVWRFALTVSGAKSKSWLLSNLGVFLLISIVQVWVVLIWIGNTLIIYADPESLYNATQTDFQTDFISKLYFSGYVLSAMGHGDYSPATDFWKFYTAFISFTGVIFISLAISYLIPVIQAVTNKRSLSLRISAIGKSPAEILVKNYKQDNFKYLIEQIYDLKPSIFQMAQQHLAYPVIHYFHSKFRYESTSICLAMIDEAMTVLECILEEKEGNSELYDKLQQTRMAITYYLSTLESGYISPGDDQPIIPDFNYLNEGKIPHSSSKEELIKCFQDNVERRKMLLAYVQNDAWQWEDVIKDNSTISVSE